jgi:hypothetical protein
LLMACGRRVTDGTGLSFAERALNGHVADPEPVEGGADPESVEGVADPEPVEGSKGCDLPYFGCWEHFLEAAGGHTREG